MRRSFLALGVALAGTAPPLASQRIDWRTTAVLYGDNTEFFTPYRTGETIFGGQVTTWLDAAVGRRTSLRVGLWADRRWGSEAFTDSLKPVLAVRHETRHSLGVIGTLENDRRHGLLDPLMVSTRELTTPIEYGLQWRERRGGFQGEAWINWQRLNTPEQREAFEVGAVLRGDLTDWLAIRAQHLWSHRGGQRFEAGVPVTNNRVTAVGAEVHGELGALGRSSLSAFGIWSAGHLDPEDPSDRPEDGAGTWLRAGITPVWDIELFAIHWRGDDFDAAAGDPNYGSVGKNLGFYRVERAYTEIGLLKHVRQRRGGVELDAEVRWHRIDDEESEAFLGTDWELSYRLVVRAPVSVRLRR
jgi:hypothetical protein